MIWAGTSGFQYPEWKGTFYPADMSPAGMLPFYAEHFPSTEINYSFYRVPGRQTLEQWAMATPEGFRFSFKAPRQITHIARLRNARPTLNRFLDALQAVQQKLGVILFQLPPHLAKDLELLAGFAADLPPDVRCAFEFRHRSWLDEEVFAWLRERQLGLCIADSEKLHTPVEFTASFGYLRLRDEGYQDKDIEQWAEVMAAASRHLNDIFVYFKHEEQGLGPRFAQDLLARLERKGVAHGGPLVLAEH